MPEAGGAPAAEELNTSGGTMSVRRLVGLGLALAVGSACNNEPTGIQVSDLAGTWNVTKWEYRLDADPGTFVDVVTVGFGATLTIQSDGSYTGTLTIPGVGNVPIAGVITIEDNVLSLGFAAPVKIPPGCTTACTLNLDPADPAIFETVVLSGNQLTVTGTDFSWPALGLPGEPAGQPANLTISLVRS